MEERNQKILTDWQAANRSGQRTYVPPPRSDEPTTVTVSHSLPSLRLHPARYYCFPEGSTRHKQNYSYTTLVEVNSGHALQIPGREVNVIGVVTDWEEPRKTRGPDLMTSIRLADLTGSVEVRVFARTRDLLPQPRNVGDILRLHRGTVSVYTKYREVDEGAPPESQTSACIVASLSKSRAAWTLFRGDVLHDKDSQEEFEPYAHSHKQYTMNTQCMKLIELLRQFSRNGSWRSELPENNSKEGENYRRMIKSAFASGRDDINHTFHDLIALVVAVEKDSFHSHHGKTIVWVWDGTNAPPYPPNIDMRFPKERLSQSEMTLDQLEIDKLMQIMYRKELDMKLVKSCPPPFGTIVPILFPMNVKAFDLEDPPIGRWIRIRNLGFTLVDSQLQGFFTQNTKYQMWRVEDDKMLEASLKEPFGPSEGCIDIDYGSIKSEVLDSVRSITNIRDVLWRARDIVDSADEQRECEFFRVRCRIMTVWPGQDDLASVCIPRSKVPASLLDEDADPDDEWLYACRFTLEDATGSLVADLFGREGAYFFSDIAPACDLSDEENAGALEKLKEAFLSLQSRAEMSPRDLQLGIWLDMCLVMFWPSKDEAHFRIFGTKLLERAAWVNGEGEEERGDEERGEEGGEPEGFLSPEV